MEQDVVAVGRAAQSVGDVFRRGEVRKPLAQVQRFVFQGQIDEFNPENVDDYEGYESIIVIQKINK